MKYSQFSKNLLREKLYEFGKAINIIDALENYLFYGFDPGSCYKALFANDATGCFLKGHQLNDFREFKTVSTFIVNHCPKIAFGSYGNVDFWMKLSDKERRQYLEDAKLVYTEEEELLKELESSDEYTNIPNW